MTSTAVMSDVGKYVIDTQHQKYSTPETNAAEDAVAQFLVDNGWCKWAQRRGDDFDPIDYIGEMPDDTPILFDVKRRYIKTDKYDSLLITCGKYDHIEKEMEKGAVVKIVVQYNDSVCIFGIPPRDDMKVVLGRQKSRPNVRANLSFLVPHTYIEKRFDTAG